MPVNTAQQISIRAMQTFAVLSTDTFTTFTTHLTEPAPVVVRTPQDEAVAAKLALLDLAERLGSVAEACRIAGFSRGTFYRLRDRYAARGETGLRELDRRGRIPKNRLEASVESLVVELALQHPTWGRRRFVTLLAERGVRISASGIRLVWKRHGLLHARSRIASARLRA
jgi:transposase